MPKKQIKRAKGESQLTEALLEAAADMRDAGIMDETTHREIAKRLSGGAGQEKERSGRR